MPAKARPIRSLAVLSGSLIVMACIAIVPSTSQQSKPKPKPPGQIEFESRCAPCHGINGQGGKADPDSLAGTLSEKELAAFISRSMPPGSKKCPAPIAAKISSYIHDAFYSPAARKKLVDRLGSKPQPPQPAALTRLTVRQFKNALSDLISGFHSAIPNSADHGLTGDYYKGRSRDQASRLIHRIDPEVRFEFGTEAPAKTGFDANNFSISWQGSVLAPDTGEYEFSIHSKFSCQLWINEGRYPVVDGEVRSAGDPDPKGSITLLGGRAYTIRMVFTKATQGVADVDKKNPKPITPSYVSLQWQRPLHATEAIPTQFLFPDTSPKIYIDGTKFPPDDRSMGFERGTSVSREWDDATTAAALEAGRYVSKNIPELTGIQDGDKDRVDRLKTYCRGLLERAFRRPLTNEVEQIYINKQFSAAPTPEAAVQRVLVLALKSPRFLYREIGGSQIDSYRVASDLSFGLWDSLPDPELRRVAASGELMNRDQIKRQAERMVSDNRSWNKVRQFLLQWLKVDEVPDLIKDKKHYPFFNESFASDLRTSLELYLQSEAWDGASDFRKLMADDVEFLNGRLSQVYGGGLPAESGFKAVSPDADHRAGVLTQPYLLSRFAYYDGSSPIHRGVLVMRNMLGRILNPPPAAFAPLAASAHPNLTTRQRVALQTKPEFCNQCHGKINPLGFVFERFDAAGRVRRDDNGHPVDETGFYKSKDGKVETFANARAMATYIATSEDSQTAFVEKLFLNVAKRPASAFGSKKLWDLKQSFAENQYSIRSLVTAMACVAAMPPDSVPPTSRLNHP